MTPQQAIELLNNTVAQINTTREGHIQLAHAIETIKKALEAPVPELTAKS